LDAKINAVLGYLLDRLTTPAMSLIPAQTSLLCPPTVAVHDYRNVTGNLFRGHSKAVRRLFQFFFNTLFGHLFLNLNKE
jgi:hypothetical protein